MKKLNTAECTFLFLTCLPAGRFLISYYLLRLQYRAKSFLRLTLNLSPPGEGLPNSLYDCTAAIPGNVFPSKYSSMAPPPVDT
jgi:hypothetical protein